MPLVSKTFSQIITFTRASTATYFDSAGVLQSAAIDVPRFDYDPATLAAQGFLIEETRTNLLLYSAEFNNGAIWIPFTATITADAAVSPDGTTTADKLVPNSGATGAYVAQNVSATAGVVYTYSFFLKAAEYDSVRTPGNGTAFIANAEFNASTGVATLISGTATIGMTSVGNGWYRCFITETAATTSSSGKQLRYPLTGDGTSGVYIWGAQIEAGSFPTSYIPTTSTALTRAADVASVNTLSPWYNASQSTIYAEWTNIAATMPTGSTQIVFRIGDGTGNNFLALFQTQGASSKASQNQFSGGVNPGRIDAGGAYSNTTVKAASAFAASDRALSANGGVAVTSATGAMPVTSIRMSFGVDDSLSVGFLNGYLRRVTYYPVRLSNAELVSLTS
jgi:hypothetical protein